MRVANGHSDMRILIIRHGDPDYSIDGLTEKGKREAELLSLKLKDEGIDAIYVSPLGRARLTAKPTEEKVGIAATVCPWLEEFSYATVNLPYLEKPTCCWDLLPEYVNTKENLYKSDKWFTEDFIKSSTVYESYLNVCRELDALLEGYGYVRKGYSYRSIKPNHKTIALVCHYGITAVLLSHLLNCSPYTVWQNCVTLPSSVTTLYTEERCEGEASFRMCGMGDLSHLYKYGEPAAFSARFCECFADETRH